MPEHSHTLNRSQALVEAGRCLGCYDAPCAQACPAGVDVPGFIARFREDNLAGASELIYAACPLGHICGTACPTPSLCEGACVLKGLGQTPIRIGALQAHITAACPVPERSGPPRPGRVAVIGAGPAGLGCAVQLDRLGHPVTVFDQSERLGGMVTRVIPAHRLPAETVELDLRRLESAHIEWELGVRIDPSAAARILQEYDAVFFGVGQQRPVVVGSTRLPVWNAYAALDFLDEQRARWPWFLADQAEAGPDWEPPLSGQRVVVIGAGNVALDAAVVAKRLGADDVIVLYRRSIAQMPGWHSEYLEACQLGVEFRWMSGFSSLEPDGEELLDDLTGPDAPAENAQQNRRLAEILMEQGVDLGGVWVQPMRFASETRAGRRWVEPDPRQSATLLECSLVLFAAGQELEPESAEAFGLEADGAVPTLDGSHRTSNPRVFAAGEAVSGGSTIVACMAAGMAAGREIHTWLEKEGSNHG